MNSVWTRRKIRDYVASLDTLVRSSEQISKAGTALISTLKAGGKVLVAGNGGSAAQAQHFAAELVVQFERQRRGLPAIALTTDSSSITAASNDLGFESVFARQLEALGEPDDLFVGISTSGSSPNVLRAIDTASSNRLVTIGLTGGAGGELAQTADVPVAVAPTRTARIQEAHLMVIHLWCEAIDAHFSANDLDHE